MRDKTMERHYKPIEPKKVGRLKKTICVLLTPVEKICYLIMRRPYMSLILIFGIILLIGYLGFAKIAAVIALSLFVLFTIIDRMSGKYTGYYDYYYEHEVDHVGPNRLPGDINYIDQIGSIAGDNVD